MKRTHPDTPPAYNTFGALVRWHRNRAGLSILDLAKAAYLDPGLLSKIERGQRQPPELPYVQLMARRLGVDKAATDELVAAAYRERFKDNPEVAKTLPSLDRLDSRRAGLAGLPPDCTAPDSPAGRYQRSKGMDARPRPTTDRQPVIVTLAPANREAAPPPANPEAAPADLIAPLMRLMSAAGAVEIRLQHAKDKTRVLGRLSDGREFEIRLGPPHKRGGKEAVPAEGNQ